MPNVTIYTTPSCGYCKMAKAFFSENKIEFQEVDVAADLKAREEMVQKTRQMGVPVIEVDGKVIVGFDRPRLQEALGLK